jgi:hypothetical protein
MTEKTKDQMHAELERGAHYSLERIIEENVFEKGCVRGNAVRLAYDLLNSNLFTLEHISALRDDAYSIAHSLDEVHV